MEDKANREIFDEFGICQDEEINRIINELDLKYGELVSKLIKEGVDLTTIRALCAWMVGGIFAQTSMNILKAGIEIRKARKE